jgi:undecaprenyl-diphosphatase
MDEILNNTETLKGIEKKEYKEKENSENKKINFNIYLEKIFTKNFKNRLFIWLAFLLSGILIETFFREKFYNLGIILIKPMQKFIQNKPLIVTLFKIMSFFASKYFIISLLPILFIFVDIYSSFIIIIIATSGSTATGFFKIIYKDPRPYFHENWINVYDCETGYGNPSGHSIVAVSIYLTLYKMLLRKNKNLTKNQKKLFGVFIIFFIISIMISRIALGSHSLNQIFFGAFFGGLIYTLFFEVFKMNFEIKKEMKIIINPFIVKLFLWITCGIFFLGFFLFYFSIGEKNNLADRIIWENRILKACPNTPYSKLYDYESIFMLCTITLYFGAYLGIFFDINFNMRGNLKLWIKENYGENKWNNSSLFDFFKRFVLFAVFAGIGFSLNFIISENGSVLSIFFLKHLIPNFMASFIMYGLNRKIFSVFSL